MGEAVLVDCMLQAELRGVLTLVTEEEVDGYNGLLTEDLGSEVVAHRIGRSFEIHMVAEVVVGFDQIRDIEVERRSLLVETRRLETHSSIDRQMLDAGTQLDCTAEEQRRNCCLYRYRLASCYSGVQAASIVAGCRQIGLPDETVHFGAGSLPDSKRRKLMERALSGL